MSNVTIVQATSYSVMPWTIAITSFCLLFFILCNGIIKLLKGKKSKRVKFQREKHANNALNGQKVTDAITVQNTVQHPLYE